MKKEIEKKDTRKKSAGFEPSITTNALWCCATTTATSHFCGGIRQIWISWKLGWIFPEQIVSNNIHYAKKALHVWSVLKRKFSKHSKVAKSCSICGEEQQNVALFAFASSSKEQLIDFSINMMMIETLKRWWWLFEKEARIKVAHSPSNMA